MIINILSNRTNFCSKRFLSKLTLRPISENPNTKRSFLNFYEITISNMVIIAAKVLLVADKKEALGLFTSKGSISEIDLSDAEILLIQNEVKKMSKKLQQTFISGFIRNKKNRCLLTKLAEAKASKVLKAVIKITADTSTKVFLPFLALSLLYTWFIKDEWLTKNKSSYFYFTTFCNYFAMLDINKPTKLIYFAGDQTVAIEAIKIVKKDLQDFEIEIIGVRK